MTTEREHVKQDLTDQLKSNHVFGSHFYDLIEQYMRFWDTDIELTALIKAEGSMVPTNTGYKMNPAIEARNKNSSQMLKIITTLGIKVQSLSNSGGDDDGTETDI